MNSEDEEGNVQQIFSVPTSETDKTRYSECYRLPKGIYYILIQGGLSGGNPYFCNDTDYQLTVNYEPESSIDHEQEYNNTIDTANKIATNTSYTGNISQEEDVDYYTFTLDKKSTVKLKAQVPRQSTDKLFTYGLYKSNGTSKIAEVKSSTNPVSYTAEKELEAGDYYVIVKKGEAKNIESEVDYSIQVMATEVEEIVATPTPEPEKVVATQTPEPKLETVAPATEKPIQTNEPAVTQTAKATVVPVATPTAEVTVQPVVTPIVEVTVQPVVTPIVKVTIAPNIQVSAEPTTIAETAAPTTDDTLSVVPTERPDMLQELKVYSDLDEDEDICVGDTFNVYAEAVPDEMNNDLEVIWKSSDSTLATVSQKGEVKCKGIGTVTISATSTDGSNLTTSMAFTIKRALSKVNTLSKIAYTQGKLTPTFTKAKTAYTLTLGKNMSSTVIRYQKTDSTSTVKINGDNVKKIKVKLKPGESKIVKITVKAENGNKRTYRIKVRRKK